MKSVHNIFVALSCFILAFQTVSFSQNPEGVPFIKNYSPKDYGASTDNWAIAQDKRGVMYFGNASGVLEYDGSKWVLIPVSNNSLVRSIAIDNDGIIYVGAVGEFGFLAPDKKGSMKYHSLLDKLPESERDFADVWKTYATPDGIYFQTFTKLIRVSKNNTVKIWKPETSFHFSYFVRNKLYIIEREKGLKQVVNNTIKPVRGGSIFSGSRIYSMLPYPAHKILIATREQGLFLMSANPDEKDSSITFINTNANEHLINDQVYGGVALDEGKFAFATLTNGVVITDIQCNIIQILNKKNGLQEDIIKNVAIDNQKDLWIALGKGISHVEISSPISSLNDAHGLNGAIQDIIKIKNSLYVATSLGVSKASDNRFIPVDGITSQTWSLKKFITPTDTFLLASSEAGIFKIDGSGSSLIHESSGYTLCQSKSDPRRVYIGIRDGISSLLYKNGQWINEDYIEGIDKEIRSIAEDNEGNLWLGTPFDGLIKIDFSTPVPGRTLKTSWNASYIIQTYDTTQGLPDMKYNIPYNFRNRIVFATNKGLYELNKRTSLFYPSGILDKRLQQSQVYRFVPKDSATLWMFTVDALGTKETGVSYLKKDGSYDWYSKPFLKITEREIHAIFPDEHHITWMGGPDELLRYDEKKKKDFSLPFFALIRRVKLGKDSIFNGAFYQTVHENNVPVFTQPDFLKPEISYLFNSVEFEFSATSFGKEEDNLFTFYLEGHDDDWSGWSKKPTKEYTDLNEGNYIFRVKAKNIYGAESIESTYAFTILPPWYRTIWAYIAYVIAFIGFVYLIIRISVRRLVKAKNQLEKIVKERTAEVVEQKHLIEEKHKEITDSINYAERIQRSFLATKELLDTNLKDHFVFFQPKDVVSGDFYWATTINSRQSTVGSEHTLQTDDSQLFILVTADSTGHGVPGSIMSILNISSLESTVKEGFTEPAEILNHTRTKIIERLKKDGSPEGGKDGMDASLISFDFKNNKLSYAAANNPVWIVRGGFDSAQPTEFIELRPDKMPVGKHDKDSIPFTQHTIELQKGDVVYALTDGFPDQFGGPKGKKFMYKSLKELLVSIAPLPMEEQKEILKTAFNNWKGTLEQVDDVCLIGVRIL